MASQQARISALLDQLTALGTKRTGMPIDADDWNALIDTIRGTLEVAAAQDTDASGALDLRYAASDHEHLAEVTSEWLAAELRGAVTGGGAAPSVTATVAGIQLGSQVGRLLDEVGRVRTVLEDQQARIDRTVTADLDRTRDVADLRGQIGTVADLRGTVSGLEGQLRTTVTQVQGLDSLRASLTNAAGAPIDVGALQTSVTELSRLRDNLTDGQGNLVRMRDVLARLDEDRAVDPGAGGLDSRFDDLRGQLEAQMTERLTAAETRIGTTDDARGAQLRADLTTQFGAQIDQQVDAARGAIEQTTDARVAAAEQRLDATIAGTVQTATGGLQDQLTGLARAAVRDGLADVDGRISTAVDAARSTIGDSLRGELTQVATDVADARIGAGLAPLRDEVTGLAGRVDAIGPTVDASVADALGARLDQLLADVDARTTARLDDARAALAGTIADQVGRAVDSQIGDLDSRVSVIVDGRLADVDTRIDQRVTARTAGLADQVRAEVQTQVGALDLSGQLGQLETRVTTNLRGEIAASETRLEATRSTALTDLATQLRNENAAGQVGLETRLASQLENRINLGGIVLRPNG